jgi:hypothetical protein
MRETYHHKIKLLRDQQTNQVVWMTFFEDDVPFVDSILDFTSVNQYSYYTSKEILSMYRKYSLTLDDYLVFQENPISKDQFDRVQLLRTKCITYDGVVQLYKFLKQKYYLETLPEVDMLTKIYENAYSLSKENAHKLALFKKKEYDDFIVSIETGKLVANYEIISCKTKEQIASVYESLCKSYDIFNKRDILNMYVITGKEPKDDMSENTSELQGNDWFSKLKNPQGASMETAQAEGAQPTPPPAPPTNVAPQ